MNRLQRLSLAASCCSVFSCVTIRDETPSHPLPTASGTIELATKVDSALISALRMSAEVNGTSVPMTLVGDRYVGSYAAWSCQPSLAVRYVAVYDADDKRTYEPA